MKNNSKAILLLFMVLLGFWRGKDGSDSKPSIWAGLVWVIVLSAAYFMGNTPIHYCYGVAVALGLLKGFSDWEDWKKMALHFTLALMVASWAHSWEAIALNVLAGLMWPIVTWAKWLPITGKGTFWDSRTRYAEVIAPMLMISGLIFI